MDKIEKDDKKGDTLLQGERMLEQYPCSWLMHLKRTCPESNTPALAKRSANITEHYFNNCTINGDLQINVNNHPNF